MSRPLCPIDEILMITRAAWLADERAKAPALDTESLRTRSERDGFNEEFKETIAISIVQLHLD